MDEQSTGNQQMMFPSQPQSQPQPQPQSQPQPQPQSQPQPQTVAIPMAELRQLLESSAKIADMQRENEARVRAEQDKATAALLSQGKTEEAFKAFQARYEQEMAAARAERQDIERRAMNHARDTALATALAEHNLRPGVSPQLMQLLRDGLEAVQDGPGIAVRTPASAVSPYKSASDYVRETLSRPEYDHFVTAQGRGGSGSSGTNLTPPQPQGVQQPGIGQQIFDSWSNANNPTNATNDWAIPIQRYVKKSG